MDELVEYGPRSLHKASLEERQLYYAAQSRQRLVDVRLQLAQDRRVLRLMVRAHKVVWRGVAYARLSVDPVLCGMKLYHLHVRCAPCVLIEEQLAAISMLRNREKMLLLKEMYGVRTTRTLKTCRECGATFTSHQAISKHRKKYHRDGLLYSGGSGFRVRRVVS